MPFLTNRFTQAVEYARIAHSDQVRKGTQVPYIYHLLGVASLVLVYEGSEDQAIAGLLHDVLEDCGSEHEATIRSQFGDLVADIVLDCTDGSLQSKARHDSVDARRRDWQARKTAYLEHVRLESEAALLVSACDKLHNASAIVSDLEDPRIGTAVFERFTADREQTLAYYESLARIFNSRGSPVARAFDSVVERMHRLSGPSERTELVV